MEHLFFHQSYLMFLLLPIFQCLLTLLLKFEDFQLIYFYKLLMFRTSTTYRNRLAGNPQISKGALEGIERLVTEETLNSFGEKINVPFDILFTTDDPNSVNTTLEYLRSV